MSDRSDQLSEFEEATRDELAIQFDTAPSPDFADVIGRMADLGDPQDETLLTAARGLDADEDDPVEELDADEARQLAAINADARVLLDATLDQRKLAAIPPAPLARRRGRWSWAAAAAIVLIAGVAGATGLVRSYLAPDETAAPARFEAEDHAVSDPSGGEAQLGSSPQQAIVEPEQEPVPEQEPEDAMPEPEPAGERARAETKSREATLDARLARLDAEAQTLWRKRDLPGAEKRFRKIVRIGGRTEYAQLAYGELFAIARQIHGTDEQAKLWRAYLRRFPRGRYADPARAGLCRGEAKSTKECWTQYLEKHPRGAARGEALKALDELP